MSYESKLYVVDEVKFSNNIIENYDGKFEIDLWNKGFYSKIATFKMGSMNPNFRDLFINDLNYELYEDNSDDIITEDCYGYSLKSAELKPVIDWLEKEIEKDDYRRLKPLYVFLKALNPAQWEHLIIIHYGY